MIKLTNIKQSNDIISTDVYSSESFPEQNYKLAFNFKTRKYKVDSKDTNLSDIYKIITRLSNYIEKGSILPTADCMAYF